MTSFVTPNSIARNFPNANLGSLPNSNPGGGKPWRHASGVLTVGEYAGLTSIDWSDVTGKPSTFPPSSHTHDASDLVSGLVAIGRLPVGSSAGTVCAGNDSRLSDSRTPTVHKSSHTLGGSDAFTASELRDILGVGTLSGSNTGDQDLSGYATLAAVAASYLPSAGGILTGLLTTSQNGTNNTGISMPSSGGAHSIDVSTNVQRIVSYNRTYIVRGSNVVFDSNGSTGFAGLGAAIPNLGRGVSITPASSANKGCVIRMAASQSAEPFELQLNDGTVVAKFTPVGALCSTAISLSSYPTTLDLPTGQTCDFINTTTSKARRYTNRAGTMEFVEYATTAGGGGSSEPTSPELAGVPMVMLPATGAVIGSIPNGSLGTQAIAMDNEYLSLFVAPFTFSIDQLLVSVSFGVLSTGEIVIYSCDTNGRPTGAPHRVSVVTSTGTQSASTSYTFVKGNQYAIGLRTEESITVRCAANTSAIPLSWSTAATPVPTFCLRRSVTVGDTGNYPTFSNSHLSTELPIWIGMRRA